MPTRAIEGDQKKDREREKENRKRSREKSRQIKRKIEREDRKKEIIGETGRIVCPTKCLTREVK